MRFRKGKEEKQRVANLQAVRQHQDNSLELGDIEANKRKAEQLREQAKRRDG